MLIADVAARPATANLIWNVTLFPKETPEFISTEKKTKAPLIRLREFQIWKDNTQRFADAIQLKFFCSPGKHMLHCFLNKLQAISDHENMPYEKTTHANLRRRPDNPN